MNCAVSTVHLGGSPSGVNQRCLLMTHEYDCDPDAGDMYKRVNHDCAGCGDRFFVEESEGYVCATRLDYHGGWGLDLKMHCKDYGWVREVVTVHMGASNSNTKCVGVHRPVTCAAFAANLGYRLNAGAWGDAFQITTSGSTVCVRRTDSHGGWGMHLSFSCTGV